MAAEIEVLADFRDRVPTQEEITSAAEALTAIEKSRNDDNTLDIAKARISASLVDLFAEALSVIARGDTLTLTPLARQLTTQEAADLLNVSRPFLIKLIEDGKLNCTYTGTHRRLSLGEVLKYKSDRTVGRREALSELQNIAEDLEID